MSDIRFNQWLHNSGTGGISQDSAGHVGIGTTVPTHINALTNNNSILHVGIVSCKTLGTSNVGGITVQQGNTQYPTTFVGGSTNGRNYVSVKAGNTTSGHSSGFKLNHSDDGGVVSMFINHDDDHGHIMNEHQGGDLVFYTNQSGSALEKLRIDSTGHLTPRGTSGTLNLGGSSNRWNAIYGNTLSLASYASVGSIVAADPGSSYYAYNNRIGSGLAIVGTTRMFGSVGIGTDNPDETLEVWKNSGTNLVKVSTQANSTVGLLIEKTGSTTQSWKIADGQTANGTLEIYDATESETRLAIDGSGRVIIGQHSHGGGGTLVVVGNSNTPNAYGCAAFCKIAANPTSGQTLAQLRFSAGSGGTNRAAEISVEADSNWNDGTNQESKMIFKVATSNGGNTAGNPLMTLKGTGDVEINRGNLVIAATKGIDFSAQTATSATGASADGTPAEVLDHYECGTWDPAPVLTYNPSGRSITSTNNIQGTYVRVGNLVHVEWRAGWVVDGSGSFNMGINGLPFNAEGTSQSNGGVGRSNVNGVMFICETINNGQINVIRRYDNGGVQATDNVTGHCVYQST